MIPECNALFTLCSKREIRQFFINNKSIQKAHEGTQVYIDYKQWTIELGGTISHYTMTLRDRIVYV